MTKLLIDCDPGHDDAVAILYAAYHLDLIGITTIYGNQSIEKTTCNALSVVELLGLDIPVAQGCAQPLNAPFGHGGDIHGTSGLDGAEIPKSSRNVVALHGVDFIIEMAHKHQDELVICPVGPLTNIALALRKEPRLTKWVRAISLMGGTTQIGNTTPVAEFNIWSDPQAADVVFRSGVAMWMVGLNVTRQVGIAQSHIEQLAQAGGVARIFADLLRFFRQRLWEVHGLQTASLHDPCALVPFIVPHLMSYQECPVEIVLEPGITRGMTVCDFRNLTSAKLDIIQSRGLPNCRVAMTVEAEPLVNHIVETIINWPPRSHGELFEKPDTSFS